MKGKEMSKVEKVAETSAYDIDGLKQDFPTAGELQKFVFDTVGISLNLKGRKNDVKYRVALDALNGNPVPDEFLTTDHPYIDKSDLIPVDDIKVLPERSKELPPQEDMLSHFSTSMVPHPDPAERAGDLKCDVTFRKYSSGLITYEILGPLEQRPIGSKVDKFGRTRPEKIGWCDPRTEERVLRNSLGEYSKEGRGLKVFLEGRQLWKWVDRDFQALEAEKVINPWA
jgi:hypothetical protein